MTEGSSFVNQASKGLLRQVLAGAGSGLRQVFATLAEGGHPYERRVNTRWNTTYTRVDLPAEEGSGCWKLFSVSDDIFMVVTDCDYTSPRVEHVPAEGLVEFHYVLEGPLALDIPSPTETHVSATTIMVCHPAPKVSYQVTCMPGRFRMISLYVQPKMLVESFGFGRNGAEIAKGLINPAPDSMAIAEVTTNVILVDALHEVFKLDFTHESHLMMVVGRMFEVLALSVTLLEDSEKRASKTIALSARELAMFENVRLWLTQEGDGDMTIAELAKRAGTNSTKLKSGFKLLYGMTIFEYRHRHRMVQVVEMLKDPSAQIAMIGTRLGYRHQASFTSACKEHFGLTPTELRKLILSDREEHPQ